MNRFIYAYIAIVLWVLFLRYGLGEAVVECVSDDAILLSVAIVAAGAMAGGK